MLSKYAIQKIKAEGSASSLNKCASDLQYRRFHKRWPDDDPGPLRETFRAEVDECIAHEVARERRKADRAAKGPKKPPKRKSK